MKKATWLFLLLLVVLTVSAGAQVYTKPDKAIATMPTEGKTLESFVPKNWEIVSEAKGDLNGDALTDAAITIGLNEDMQGMLDNFENSCEAPPYIITVLFATEKGSYKRVATNGRMYPSCENAVPTLQISKGALITNQNFRDGWAIDATYRFRYDPNENKLMLIGFDLEHYSRSNIYEGSKTSENYLTGTRIEYAKSACNRKSSAYSETKKSRIPRSIIYFEEARFKEAGDDDVDMVRPF